MIQQHGMRILLCSLAMLATNPACHAGSERLMMSMTEEKMNLTNLIWVQFFGPDGAALESDRLKVLSIREQDCGSGIPLKLIDDFKIGYGPSKLVGIYVYPHAWQNKTLCFSIPGIGESVNQLDPDASGSRTFRVQLPK